MNAFYIRRATVSDAEMLGRIAARTFTDTFGHLYKPQDLETYLATAYAKMQKEIEDSNKYTVFLFPSEEAKTPCGFSMVSDGSVRPGDEDKNADKYLELKRFYMEKEFHGTGAASVLMKHVMEVNNQAKNRPIVWLIVWENNFRAHNFYKKYGFHETGEHFYQVGEHMDREFVFSLQQPELLE
ncbi:hypothetical protein Poli38472_005187 [Pythium oligandrum]|uniref:N-acetyltransferase domain-containing protein n=1 Tax=Pythium oligandrum TaxID=41045 RepID=A0A8K1CGF5_PYTOL|nr:hypothetical protein Poli38472_005187 [Pythium oligandrum]|eukprot:TMW62569.1 hypothetical protein Poli38472_005187 [Pythium oligandrum]